MFSVIFIFLLMSFGAESVPVNLTTSPSQDRYPSWSPDGKRIAFETDRNGNWDIFVMNSDGSGQRALTSGPANDRFPRWSPDGKRVLFVREEKGESDLYAIVLDEKSVKPIAKLDGDELFPDWRPDGKVIAFTSGTLPDLDLFELNILTGKPVKKWSSSFRDVWPRYSKNGDIVFFSRRDTNDEEDEIYIVDKASGEASRLTELPGNDFCPAWSPDGERIAFARVDPQTGRSIVILDLTTKERLEIGRGFERVTEPDWSPDGKMIAYTARKGDVTDVWVENVPDKSR